MDLRHLDVDIGQTTAGLDHLLDWILVGLDSLVLTFALLEVSSGKFLLGLNPTAAATLTK